MAILPCPLLSNPSNSIILRNPFKPFRAQAIECNLATANDLTLLAFYQTKVTHKFPESALAEYSYIEPLCRI